MTQSVEHLPAKEIRPIRREKLLRGPNEALPLGGSPSRDMLNGYKQQH